MIEREPRWKREARGLVCLFFTISCAFGWLAGHYDIEYYKAGTDMLTAEKTVEKVRHGHKKNISAAEAKWINFL